MLLITTTITEVDNKNALANAYDYLALYLSLTITWKCPFKRILTASKTWFWDHLGPFLTEIQKSKPFQQT